MVADILFDERFLNALQRHLAQLVFPHIQAVHLAAQPDKLLRSHVRRLAFKFADNPVVYRRVQSVVGRKIRSIESVYIHGHVVVQIFSLDMIGEGVCVRE